MVTYKKPKPLIKRIPTILDPTDGVQRWDWDNQYPQRMDELASRSYTLNAVRKVLMDFFAGEGFEDEVLANMQVNHDYLMPETFLDLLNRVVEQYTDYETPSLHFGFDMNGKMASIRTVPVCYNRFGMPDDNGIVSKIMYSTNWERAAMKESHDRYVFEYDLFNPNPEVVKEQIAKAGGISKYRGQILFDTPIPFVYPKATFDPVSDHAQTQAELGVYKIASIQNKFNATMAIMYPGQFESDEEKRNFQELIATKSGSEAAGSNLGIQDPTGTKKVNEIFMPITPVNTDRLFELTEKSSISAIMENEAVPKELIGVRPETGMFNQDNMEQSYIYFNSRTRKRRKNISRLFSFIASNLPTPLVTKAEIKELSYMTAAQKAEQQQSKTQNNGK